MNFKATCFATFFVYFDLNQILVNALFKENSINGVIYSNKKFANVIYLET